MKTKDIRKLFKAYVDFYNPEPDEMISLKNVAFEADEPVIFGTPNHKYIESEILWYESQSRDVRTLFDIYGKEVQIWKQVADADHKINSNYGWMVFSEENGNQYLNVLNKLKVDPNTRQALMIYQRPSMHTEHNRNGMSDFTCCNNVMYYIDDDELHSIVSFRSNDAIFGYINDRAWMRHIQMALSVDLDIQIGKTHWHAMDLHIYPRHRDLII